MAKYDSAWSGVDRGHEGQWNPRVWILPLRALDTHGPFDYNDLKHSFYDEVQSKAPELGWISKNSVTGESRSLFRDNREPWAATGVIDFDDTMMTLSDIGKKVVDGVLTYGDVLTSMMSRWSEHGENPFAVLSEVFLSVDAYRGLTFEEVIAVMQNYRRGDSLIDALQASTINITATAKRRLRALLLLMVYAGAVVPGNEVYFAGDRGRLSAILKLSNDDLREEFSVWLTDVYRKAGGKKIGKTTVNSYVNALSYLTDADAYPGEYDHCSTSYWYNMYHYLYGEDGSPVYALETKEAVLKEFGGVYAAITEGNPPEGVDVDHFNQVRLWSQKEEVKNSSWIFYAFQRYFDFLDWRLKNKAQEDGDAPLCDNRLMTALKLFQNCRGGGGDHSEDGLESEFKYWCTEIDGKAKNTPSTYLPPLKSISKPHEMSGRSSTWIGVYDFVFGHRPTKDVLEIDSVTELKLVYGDILKAFEAEDLPMPTGAIPQNWNKVRAWVKADKAKGNKAQVIHKWAFEKYEEFLTWRAEQGPAVPHMGPAGWTSYDAWAKEVRAEFAKADAGMFVAAGFDYSEFMRKFVYNTRVSNSYFKDHTDADKNEVGNFISQNRTSPHAASWYIDKVNLPQVKGFGPGVALNFMMKVRPEEFVTFSPMLDAMLMTTGVLKTQPDTALTLANYEASKAAQGLVLAKMHELKIGKATDDDSAADYLTVDEFAWWLSDEKNKNLVKEKVMCAQLKPVNSKDSLVKGKKKLDDAFAGDALLKRLAAALRTKPFAILAGHSGTGKSQLVRRLAYMTCNNQKLIDEGKGKTAPGNYCMVQVKPNWHDSTDLLGYYSDLGTRHFVNTAFVQFLCKAYAYPETPFFLCLDEMNLAPVEQYFAEYLSAVESLEKKGNDWVSDSLIEIVKTGEKDENGNAKVDEQILGQIMAGAQSTEAADWIRKHGLTIPKNLFVVGTVNMDETTCQFSRKVLDRAMTLLMNDVKFAEMGKSVDPSKEELLDEAGIAFFMHGGRRGHVAAPEAGLLDNLNKPLVNTPFVVAYRFANEYALYEEALANLGGLAQLDEGETDEAKIAEYWKNVSGHAEEALDHVVLMKLLPRIHGMKDVVRGIFEGRKIDEKDIPGLKDEVKTDGLSAGMMTEILNRGDEYLTFWP